MKILWVIAACAGLAAAQESGTLKLHEILHPIGEERYEVKRTGDQVVMTSTTESADRGTKRTIAATLEMSGGSIGSYQVKTGNSLSSVVVTGGIAKVTEGDKSRDVRMAPNEFVALGASPFATQWMLVRYWQDHGKPARLPMLRATAGADDVEIRATGRDSIHVAGKAIGLTRFTIGNVVFGREVLWLDDQKRLAAVMTFAGGLPLEAIREEYASALPELFHAGVAQQMADLAELGREVAPEKTGTFAIAGATLVDGNGGAPVKDSVVVVRDGKIVAAGPRSAISIPKGAPIVDGSGETLLPGLWEMHIHYSGIEFGPPLLAAGVTTARECGGEFDFLIAVREAIRKHALGPRLVMAGLVDSSEPAGFGAISADTPEEGRAVVAKYHAAGFEQMKLYTRLKPDVIKAISAEAHRLGMTVTGHVPAAVDAFEGVEDGMDQINHLQFVTAVMRPKGSREPVDLNSEQARKAIQFFKDHHTVIDPTAGWGEMAGHSKDMDVTQFEPGVMKAPFTLSSKFIAMGAPVTESERVHARFADNLAVIGALHRAGITIIPGSDTGLVGYGLDRELELYVQAGMTPMEAIQAATIVSARAMGMERESGTIEAGKRADLILVHGDPLRNISDLRHVSRVVTDGRLYDAAKLWKSVGFKE